MKRSVTFILLLVGMVLLTTSYSSGPLFGGAGNRTGSAGSRAGCDGPICHASNGGSSSLSIALLQNGVPVNSYVPGGLYRIRLTLPVSVIFRRYFGFQASVVKAGDGVTQAGFLGSGGRSDVSVHQDVLVQLAEHNKYIAATPLGSGTYLDTVSFSWQAPAAGFGSVRVYGVINSVDSSRSPSGDQPRAGFQDFREETTNAVAGGTAMPQLMLLPNPAPAGARSLKLLGVTAGLPLRLAVVDMRGQVLQRKADLPALNGAVQIGLDPLPPGRFVLVVSQGAQLRSTLFEVK